MAARDKPAQNPSPHAAPATASQHAQPSHDLASPADLNGFLIVDKPAGISSARAVAMVKRSARGARTGHGGTLDPLATGVLVMAVGKATRSLQQVIAADKRYVTRIDLGSFSSTDDREGEMEPVQAEPPARERLEQVIRGFVGHSLQPPPAYSAVKVGGRRSYQLARSGKAVTHEPRPVMVHAMHLVTFDWPQVEVEMHCGAGFYVRSFARMLGQALGTGGHCASIRRSAVGPFTLEHSVALDRLPPQLHQADLLAIDRALAMVREHMAKLPASPAQAVP